MRRKGAQEPPSGPPQVWRQLHQTFALISSNRNVYDNRRSSPSRVASSTLLHSKLFFSRHRHTDVNKATRIFWNIFPLLARYSALIQSNTVTLYKLLIRSILTYAAAVCSSTCLFSYLRLQVIQSKCLRVIGNHPRRTPTSHLHNSLNIQPIPRSHPPPYWQIFRSLPLTPQSLNPTNWELYSSRPGWLVQKI